MYDSCENQPDTGIREIRGIRDRYSELMREYDEAHCVCPVCHHTTSSSTYVGYAVNLLYPEEYRNQNAAACECGWSGIVHDLRPRSEADDNCDDEMLLWLVNKTDADESNRQAMITAIREVVEEHGWKILTSGPRDRIQKVLVAEDQFTQKLFHELGLDD